MKQIKLQEFANLFDVFMCRNSNDPYEYFSIYGKEPILTNNESGPCWKACGDDEFITLPPKLFSDSKIHDYKTLIRPEKIQSRSLNFVYPQENIAEEINSIDTKLTRNSVIESDPCLYKITAIVRNISFSNVLKEKDVYVIDSSVDTACSKVEEYFKGDFIEIIKIKIKGTENTTERGTLPKLLQ